MRPAALLVLLCAAARAGATVAPEEWEKTVAACPESWVEHGDLCFFYSGTMPEIEGRTLADHCSFADPAAVPAIVHDAATDALLASLTDRYGAWLGLSRGTDGTWVWSDGSSLNYTNWGQGEPQEGRDCAALGSYKSRVAGNEVGGVVDANSTWKSWPCSNFYEPYLCQLSP